MSELFADFDGGLRPGRATGERTIKSLFIRWRKEEVRRYFLSAASRRERRLFLDARRA